MNDTSPTVSVLITTFNRSSMLRRAIDSVLMQDFDDFELVIIDDCSSDDTTAVVQSYSDQRIRYIRNEENVGGKEGDRPHMRRFIYELMRGTYFVYLCDDDYWLMPDLLSRQVEAFNIHENLAMVMGGQLSYFLTSPDSYFGHEPDDTKTFTLDNIHEYFDLDTLTSKNPHIYFMQGSGPNKSLFPSYFMTSEEFLENFATEPANKNIIGGAMLYSRECFIRSGGFASSQGSQWQAGYELKMGPACFGDVVYMNEPSIVTEIRSENASFGGTQVDHYLDSVVSIEKAFEEPLKNEDLKSKRKNLRRIRALTVRNLGRAFMYNTLCIRRTGKLGMCSAENMSVPVTLRHVLSALVRNRGLHVLQKFDLRIMTATVLPDALFKKLDDKYLPH